MEVETKVPVAFLLHELFQLYCFFLLLGSQRYRIDADRLPDRFPKFNSAQISVPCHRVMSRGKSQAPELLKPFFPSVVFLHLFHSQPSALNFLLYI